MSPLNTPVVPVKMEQARQQLERWRSTRAHRSPIPEPLWALAVQLARRYGIFATARALRLDYIWLKARLESARRSSVVCSKPAFRRAAAPAFVELIAPRPLNTAFILPPCRAGSFTQGRFEQTDHVLIDPDI